MRRNEITFFLKNVPGEMGKLTTLLKEGEINIESIAVQDASAYVQALFNARGKSLKRIASTASYVSMQKDSYEFALIRLLVDQTDKAAELLAKNDYIFELTPVIAVHLENKVGILAEVTTKLGDNNININYIYGSAAASDDKCLLVFNPEDIELAERTFESLKE